MRVLSETFFNRFRLFVFGFTVILSIIPAYPILMSKQINYRFYLTVLTFGFFIFLFIRKLLRQEKIKFDFFLLFFGYLTVNLFLAQSLRLINVPYQAYQSTVFLIGYYVIFVNNKSKNVFLTCIKMLVLMGVYQSCLGFSQVVFNYPMYDHLLRHSADEAELFEGSRNYFAMILPGVSKSTTMATGTFHHFNYLGAFVKICCVLAYGLYLYYRKSAWYWAFIMCFIGVVVTFSRGALMSVIIGLLVVYFSFTQYKLIKLYFFAIFAIIFYVGVGEMLKQYAEETGHSQVRYETWVYAAKYAVRQPQYLVFGYGLNHFRNKVMDDPPKVWKTQYQKIMQDFHSSFVQIFLEQGLVGFIFFVLAIGSMAINMLRTRNLWGYVIVGTTIAYLIGEAFEHSMFTYIGGVYFILVALFIGTLKNTDLKSHFADEVEQQKTTKVKEGNLVTA